MIRTAPRRPRTRAVAALVAIVTLAMIATALVASVSEARHAEARTASERRAHELTDRAAEAAARRGLAKPRRAAKEASRTGDATVVGAGAASARVPDDEGAPVTVTDASGVTLGLSRPTGLVEATAIAQATEDGAVRTAVVLESAATREVRFPLSLPEGTHPVINAAGGVDLVGPAGPVGGIDAPWAVDAHGSPVATTYTLDGSVLVQHVEVAGVTAFPVVADPSLWAIATCVAAIAWVVGTTVIPLGKITKVKAFIKGVGGIREAAKLLLGATTKAEKIAFVKKRFGPYLAGLAGEILGISAIQSAC